MELRGHALRHTLAAVLAVVAAAICAPSASAADPAAWTCDAFGYLFQGVLNDSPGAVQRIDLATGDLRTIGTSNVFASTGYNTLDNYVYAWDTRLRQMLRVANDLTLTPVASGSFAGTGIGDFDDSGHYWALSSSTISELDYAPGSPTYGQVVRTLPVGARVPRIAIQGSDWAWSNGFFYMIGVDLQRRAHLLRIDGSTGARVDLTPTPFDGMSFTGGFGAVFADADGYVYGIEDNSGTLLRVDPRTLRWDVVRSPSLARSASGARCVRAPVPTITVRTEVDGRVRPDDQFAIGLADAVGTPLASATTVGMESSAAAAPALITQDLVYTIAAGLTPGSPTPDGEYATSIACVDGAGDTVAVDAADAGNWTLHAVRAAHYTCTVTHSAQADLTLQTSASPSRLTAGESVTYTLAVLNRGPSTAIGASVSDPLPSGLELVSAGDGCTFADGTVTCGAGDLAPGATARFTVTARVAANHGAGTLVNTATAASATPDPNPGDNSSTTTVDVVPPIDPVPTDRTPVLPVLPEPVPDPGSGGTPAPPDPGGAGSAPVPPGPGPAPGTGDGGYTGEVPRDPRADLSIRQQMSVGRAGVAAASRRAGTRERGQGPARAAVAGPQLIYTLTVRNTGPSTATGVRVVDVPSLPVAVRSVTTTAGSCSGSVPIRCALGPLARGATAKIRIVLAPRAPGALRNHASVAGRERDPRSENNVDVETTAVRGLLEVGIVASSPSVRAGARLRYRVTVANRSAFPLRSVRVCDELPRGVVLLGTRPPARLVDGRICWSIGTLGAHRSATLVVHARALPGHDGRQVNTVVASAPGTVRSVRDRVAVQVLSGLVRADGVTG